MGVVDIRGKLQKNCKIGNFEGASIRLRQALDRECLLQKHFLTSYLLFYVCSNGNLKQVARAQQFYSAKICDV